MSMPTFYTIYNDAGQKIGTSIASVFRMFAISKKSQPDDFACEVAKILLDDISVYCSGKQKNAPTPAFRLEDVAALKSEGGKLTRKEFPQALRTFAERMDQATADPAMEKEIETYFKPRKAAALSLAQRFADIIAARSVSVKKPTPPAITP